MDEYRISKNRKMRLATAGHVAKALSDVMLTKDDRERQLLADLTDLVLHPEINKTAIFDLVAHADISCEEMADYYIPNVARSLGDLWCSDQLQFAEVTIGVARLQAMLRDLGEKWTADLDTKPNASTVLMVVLDDVHHTLGAFVIAGQLRRKGLSVRLLIGATAQNIRMSCEMIQYDAIFISANIGDSLENLRKIVRTIKTACDSVPPVVIGGTLLETGADVVALTGTDYIAQTADEAIALCNLRIEPHTTQAVVQ